MIHCQRGEQQIKLNLENLVLCVINTVREKESKNMDKNCTNLFYNDIVEKKLFYILHFRWNFSP